VGTQDVYREIEPGRKRFKVAIIKIAFFVLGRAFQSAARVDKQIRREIEEWPEGFSLMIQVLPNGPRMALAKDERGHLRHRRRQAGGPNEDKADLIVFFKNLECAFLLFSAQISTAQAYAEHRISVKGELPMAMALVRCINIVETYLLPGPVARRMVKRLPSIPAVQRCAVRLLIYVLGIPVGI
jgi:hypothetical protein